MAKLSVLEIAFISNQIEQVKNAAVMQVQALEHIIGGQLSTLKETFAPATDLDTLAVLARKNGAKNEDDFVEICWALRDFHPVMISIEETAEYEEECPTVYMVEAWERAVGTPTLEVVGGELDDDLPPGNSW